MNRADLAKHILLILAGLFVLFWTLYLMVSPLKFALSITLFLITIVAGELLLSPSAEKQYLENRGKLSRLARRISGGDIAAVGLALSLAIIFRVPAIEGEIFVDWVTLGLPIVARMIAAFGLNFLPGYLILAIIGSQEHGKLWKFVTSYLLSVVAMSITGFVSAYIVGVIDDFFLVAFLLVCGSLIIAYALKRFIRWKLRPRKIETSEVSSTGSRNMLPTLLVGLGLAFMVVWIWWMYSGIGFFAGTRGMDMWRAHGAAQAFIDNRAFRWLHAPWWFYLYLASYIVMSGAPSVNAYLSSYPLLIVPFLSFYLMTSGFFKDKRKASLATLGYTIFSGPAWLYALYLRNFAPSIDYQDWTRIIFQAGDKFLLQGWYAPFVMGFGATVVAYATLWWLIYATWRLDFQRRVNLFLVSIIVATSYLLHGVDAVIYVVYLAALLIAYFSTNNLEGKRRVRYGAYSVLVALGIVALVDLSLTSQYDYFNSISLYALSTRYYYFNSPSFYVLGFASLSIVALTYISYFQNTLTKLFQSINQKLESKYFTKTRLVEAIFLLYGVSLVVFVAFLPSLTITDTGLGWVPWYVYPVVGGVPALLGLAGIALSLREWNGVEKAVKEILVFCALSVLLLFIFGQVTSFVNEEFFYTGYWERRTQSYISPIISILMAYAAVTLYGRISVKRPINARSMTKIGAISFLTSLLVLSSVSSTLIAGDLAARIFFVEKPTDEELEALTYLHYSLPTGFKTAYINRQTGTDYIRAFANDKWTESPDLWWRYNYPSAILAAVRRADIKYLYLNHIRDAQDLNRNLFIRQLIKVLPVVFSNSEVTIYSIPPLRLPFSLSSLGLVSPVEKEGESYDAYVLWYYSLMMSNLPYMVIENATDPDILVEAKNILLPYDPMPMGTEVGPLLDWVYSGGHLTVSNTNLYGFFSELLGLESKVSLVNCDSVLNWTTRINRGQIFLESGMKVEGEASIRLQNNMSAFEEWIYTPSAPWNLSSYRYLGAWIHSTGGGPQWALFLTDSSGNENYYRIYLSTFDRETETYSPSFTGWKRVLIPIEDYYGALNLSSITQLRMITGFQLPVDILVDDIFVFGHVGEESLVSADYIEGAVDIGLGNIEIENMSSGLDTTVIANYTQDSVPVAPFALQKEFGNGTVTYLNINLLYQYLISESYGIFSPHEIFIKILEIIGVQRLP